MNEDVYDNSGNIFSIDGRVMNKCVLGVGAGSTNCQIHETIMKFLERHQMQRMHQILRKWG